MPMTRTAPKGTELMATSQPRAWVEAFKAQAELECKSLSVWVGEQCRAGLTVAAEELLPRRRSPGNPGGRAGKGVYSSRGKRKGYQ